MTEAALKEPTPVPVKPKPIREPMDTNNRCDKCGAQAYVRVYVTVTSSLEFCGHHWTEIRSPKLDKYEIQDETSLITKKRDTE